MIFAATADLDDAPHFCWSVPVLSAGCPAGRWAQVQLRCRCGYREVLIPELAGMYAGRHYRAVGVEPQPVPFGWNGAGDSLELI